MSTLLVAEELFLLTHDDESGKSTTSSLAPEAALAGAVLLDLAEHGVMTVEEKKVVVADAPAEHPLLAEAQAVIGDASKRHSVSHWVNYLPNKLKKLDERVGDSLVERGVLAREDGKVMGLFKTTRWPEVDPHPEQALRAALVELLVRGATPTAHQELLVPLLDSQDMIPKLVEKDDRKQAKATAKALTKAAKEGRLVSASVSQTVAATQAAVLMLIITPSIAATATAN